MAEALKYKASFATASFHCATAYFLRQGLRSEALLLAHYGNSAIRAASKRLLAAIGLRQPVLGMVRRAAGIAGRPSVEAGA